MHLVEVTEELYVSEASLFALMADGCIWQRTFLKRHGASEKEPEGLLESKVGFAR